MGRALALWVALAIFLAVITVFLVGIEVEQLIDDNHPLADHVMAISFVISYLITLRVWIGYLRSQRKLPVEE